MWKKLNRKKIFEIIKKIYNQYNKLGVNVLYRKPKYIIYFFLEENTKVNRVLLFMKLIPQTMTAIEFGNKDFLEN